MRCLRVDTSSAALTLNRLLYVQPVFLINAFTDKVCLFLPKSRCLRSSPAFVRSLWRAGWHAQHFDPDCGLGGRIGGERGAAALS